MNFVPLLILGFGAFVLIEGAALNIRSILKTPTRHDL